MNASEPRRAFVCGCAGAELTADERAFIARWRPWGLILFRRNVVDPAQVRRLTNSFRDVLGAADAPVLVDQEGGRVQRLGPPHWPAYPAAGKFGRIGGGAGRQEQMAHVAGRLIAADLRAAGISVDCLPVLDVPAPGSHSVIGDRAYADTPERVAALGLAAAEGLMAGGVLPVVKHSPGHGRARADSHLELPVVTADRATLEATDFMPFRAARHLPAGMTAHVVYTAIDPDRPGTISPRVIDVIRRDIGFSGLLMTDDLSMKALTGTLGERAAAALAAGVDVALHCSGDLAEALAVAQVVPVLGGESQIRAEAALAHLRKTPGEFHAADARRDLENALADLA